MEYALPLSKPNINHTNELNIAEPERHVGKIKAFKTVHDDFFDEEDADPIDVDYDNPFNKVWDDTNAKRKKYGEKFPKDDSITDTDLDSTDTEPTDTGLVSTSDSMLSLYKTTTDPEEEISIDPNTEKYRDKNQEVKDYTSPSYHPSEDDTDESTDSEYFDSDAETESSEKSYSSRSEDVDDTPDYTSGPDYSPPKDDPSPPDGGPPETFKWSEDENMEIPMEKSKAKKIFDPFEDQKRKAEEKFGPGWITGDPNIKWNQNEGNSKIENVLATVAKHVAPRNFVSLESDWSDRLSGRVTPYKNFYRLARAF